jgi:hypothetical protein
MWAMMDWFRPRRLISRVWWNRSCHSGFPAASMHASDPTIAAKRERALARLAAAE